MSLPADTAEEPGAEILEMGKDGDSTLNAGMKGMFKDGISGNFNGCRRKIKGSIKLLEKRPKFGSEMCGKDALIGQNGSENAVVSDTLGAKKDDPRGSSFAELRSRETASTFL